MTQSHIDEVLMEAFAAVLRNEDAVREIKTRADAVIAKLDSERVLAERGLREAWDAVEKLLAETGEYEVLLPGAVTDYKLGWSKPRESVKVDAEAVPDEFVKFERKPKLKEIGDHLKTLRESGQDMPNWASLERGEPKLGWTAVKKKTTNVE